MRKGLVWAFVIHGNTVPQAREGEAAGHSTSEVRVQGETNAGAQLVCPFYSV